MAHEGFNWKQQSLLACILFSSRVQRTPIISFLLYCLFSSPPAALPASSPSLQNRQQNYPFPLSAPLASTVLPRPTLHPPVPRFLRVSQRFVSRTFPKRPRFPSSSRLPRYPPVPPPPPPLPSPLPPHLTARSPLRARRIFHGIPAFFNGGEGKNVRLRMKDQPRVGRDEKSSSGLLRSFRKPSFVPRIGNIEQTGRRGPTFLYFFLLFLFLGNCQFNCLLRPGRSTKRLISMCIVSDV